MLVSSGGCGRTPTDVYSASPSVLADSMLVKLGPPSVVGAPTRVIVPLAYINAAKDTILAFLSGVCGNSEVFRAATDTATVWRSADWLQQHGEVCEASLTGYSLAPGDSVAAEIALTVADVLGDSLAPGPYAVRFRGFILVQRGRNQVQHDFVLTSEAASLMP